jgi:lipopolysaccharide export system protein LptC
LIRLSQNEALRAKSSFSGTASERGAGGLAGLEQRMPPPEFTRPDDEPDAERRVQGAAPASRWSRLDVTPVSWRGGFKAAYRHSARVRLLRRAAIAGSLLVTVLISAAAFVSPLKNLPVDLSTGRVGFDGTKVTLDVPKITGVQKDGRPFEIKAHSAIQDLTKPNVVELLGIESSIGTADNSTTWVSAERGIYDSSHDKMTLEGDIRIKNSAGYDIWLKTARIDFKTGGLVSEEPVKVLIEGGTIAAKQLDVSDNGHKVSFGGDVTSTIKMAQREPEAGDAIEEPVR